MQLAIIAPFHHLNDFTTSSPQRCYLALAHLVLKNAAYREFFRAQSRLGHTVITDNGASELKESIEAKEVYQAASLVEADAVVCPDVLFESDETIKRTEHFIDQYYDRLRHEDTALVGVCQGRDLAGWLKTYNRFTDDPRIKTIAVSNTNFLFKKYQDRWDHRIKLINFLVEKGLIDKLTGRDLHLLGLGSNGHWELNHLKNYDFITSVDSSAPVVHGYYGIRFSLKQPYEKIRQPLDFGWQFDEEQQDNAQHNIRILEKTLTIDE